MFLTHPTSKPHAQYRCGIAIIFFLITLTFSTRALAGAETALFDYVKAPDPNFNYSLAGPPITGDGFKLYVIYMNSQQWRITQEVDRPLWSHWMAMIVPDVIATDTGMLFIAGGDNIGGPALDSTEVAIATFLATSSQSIVTIMGQVPNQPLFFADELFAHSEDALIAYSWDRAMNRLDWQWPAYLPMTKAAVRAMDTVQALSATLPVTPIRRFVVTGFSKRGAATWLTGAVDPRVRAIAPGVFDVLNLDQQLEQHFSAYGFYSNAIDDYANYDLLRRLRTPEGQDLLKVVDPLSYLSNLRMPKFLLNSPGDQFFLPDSARFYFDKLPGEHLIRYVANTDHGLETAPGDVSDALYSLLGWYLGIIYEQPRPTIHWQHAKDKLIVKTDQTPLLARFWQAHNTTARDFRLQTTGRIWQAVLLQLNADNRFSIDIPKPTQGWTAYYVDFIFPGVANVPQTYSTAVFISPDNLPFTVSDPLRDPKGYGYWKQQIDLALHNDTRAQIPANTLASYFPLPLFDQSVANIAAAAIIFATDNNDPKARARKHCLALRLNVLNDQLGWYSALPDTEHDDRLFVCMVKPTLLISTAIPHAPKRYAKK